MARQRVEAATAKKIAWRLSAFVFEFFGGWYRFERESGIPRPTVLGWRRKQAPSVPDVPYLLQLAADYRLNPSWLLLGIGPLRIEPTELPEPIEERLRAIVMADLATSEGISRKRVDRCLPPAELVYRAALVEMRRMVRVMTEWDRKAANEQRRVKRRRKAAEKTSQAGRVADWAEALAEVRARHNGERTEFMAREISSWSAREDSTRGLEPRA